MPAQRAVPGIGEIIPDFIKYCGAVMGRRHRRRSLVDQAPANSRRTGSNEVAAHTEPGLIARQQSCRSIEIANQATPLGSDIQHHLQAFRRQAGQASISTDQTQVPHPTQATTQAHTRGIGQIEHGLVGRGRFLFFAGQVTAGVVSHRQRRRSGQRQAGHETSSRNRHRPTCVNREARFIQLERSVRRQIYWHATKPRHHGREGPWLNFPSPASFLPDRWARFDRQPPALLDLDPD